MARDTPADGPAMPLSDAAFTDQLGQIAKIWRIVSKRAPASVTAAIDAAVSRAEEAIESGNDEVALRLEIAHELEGLLAELRGRGATFSGFYGDGKLGIIRFYDPIRIRECINYPWVNAHMERLESRARRGQARLDYFFERCGLIVEEKPELKPWQEPYYGMQESTEFLWRKR